jgi:hypothetical protein
MTMASNRPIEANRSNAKRSTGPKTATGKAKSSRNALRHGFARSRTGDGHEVSVLAAELSIALERHAATIATDLAGSRLQLLRIRLVRHGMLAALLEAPAEGSLDKIQRLERYERAAMVGQNALSELCAPGEPRWAN